MKLFADDVKLYSVISSLNNVQPLQRSVNKAGTWSIDWEMLFNIKKMSSATCQAARYRIHLYHADR